jgi:hypothetical protein
MNWTENAQKFGKSGLDNGGHHIDDTQKALKVVTKKIAQNQPLLDTILFISKHINSHSTLFQVFKEKYEKSIQILKTYTPSTENDSKEKLLQLELNRSTEITRLNLENAKLKNRIELNRFAATIRR